MTMHGRSEKIRVKQGQVFTPRPIADAMTRWVCGCRPSTFLDPAVGEGAFLRSLPSGVRCVAMDIDPSMLGAARASSPDLECEWICRDFLRESLGEFDGIVCNPPYIRHQDVPVPPDVLDEFGRRFGVRFSGRTNIYAAFLLRIAMLLKDGGRAAVITPSEFLNTNFGGAVKQALLATPSFRGMIVFHHVSEVFKDALTTAAITLFDASRSWETLRMAEAAPEHPSEAFEEFGSARPILRDSLDPGAKWLPGGHIIPPDDRPDGMRQLSDFARCKRGIVTGAKPFFVLSVADAARWCIHDRFLKSCVTMTIHAPGEVFTDDDHRLLVTTGKKVLLLDATGTDDPGVRKYITYGESLGLHLRYLSRTRKPWYAMERREPADIWVTVFGRGRLRFVRNESKAINLTAFHGIKMKPEFQHLLPALTAYFRSPLFQRLQASQQRVYSRGLMKYEPGDVQRLPVPDFENDPILF